MLFALMLAVAPPLPSPMSVQRTVVSPPAQRSPEAPPTRARAVGSLPSLFTGDDYPAQALDNGDQGMVVFRLSISPEGRVDACHIVESSGTASLDHVTCAILQRRARFVPARDARGKAVKDALTSRAVWQIDETADYETGWISMSLWPAAKDRAAECLTVTHFGVRVEDCDELEIAIRAMWQETFSTPFPASGGVHVTMRFEPGHGPVLKPTLAPGETALMTEASQFSITYSGRVSDCRIVGQSGATISPHKCGGMAKIIFPLEFDRQLARPGRAVRSIGLLPPRVAK